MKKILEEFKAFALKGNMIDMAVAVIIGGAFNSLITSLVENVVCLKRRALRNPGGRKGADLRCRLRPVRHPADQFPDHGLCCVPCHPPVKQTVQKTGSACKADRKRMPVLQNENQYSCDTLSALYIGSGRSVVFFKR